MPDRWSSPEQVAQIVKQCLEEGKTVEIDGLGSFQPDSTKGYQFIPLSLPTVFIAYVQEDAELADRLFDDFAANGFDPWLDRRKLLPGQNWPRSIEAAIDISDFFIACFSHRSVTKRGAFHAEIRYALDCARLLPLDEIFVIPVRLDSCSVPPRIQRELQYIDLFPDWDRGFRRILAILSRHMKKAKQPAA